MSSGKQFEEMFLKNCRPWRKDLDNFWTFMLVFWITVYLPGLEYTLHLTDTQLKALECHSWGWQDGLVR